MKIIFIMAAFLVGCTTPIVYYDQEFEWVEPLIFQHNLDRCRARDVCNAAELFDG
jgi:hypothetical protein